MKFALYLFAVSSTVVLVKADWSWWGSEPQPDEPQADYPYAQTQQDEGSVQVLQLVEALTNDLKSMSGQEDGWLERFKEIAVHMKENNNKGNELLGMSKKAIPIIWSAFMGKMMMYSFTQIKKGSVASPSFSPFPPPPPKFLFVSPSEMTPKDTFVMQATVHTTAEANVGFCAFYEPGEGRDLDFDNDDIFFAMHIRWHFDYGNSKEIAFNDRYNGQWSRPEVVYGSDRWPDFQVGEKFLISAAKYDYNCFQVSIYLGRELHMHEPVLRAPFMFCPKGRKLSDDSRKLWLTANEDKTGANEVVVHYLTWFPV